MTDSSLGAELVALGQSLVAELDLDRLVQAVTDAATRLSGAAFGALFYNMVDDRGEAYSLYTLSGVPREAFEHYPMPRKTAVFGPTFDGAGPVRSDDITLDPRYGHNAPHHGMPRGHLAVRSYLAVSVVARSGEVIGGLFLGHPEPGIFTEREEQLLKGLAAHAAVAIDNARLFARTRATLTELREADRRKDEFLAMLAHELRNPLAPLTNALALLDRSAVLTDDERLPLTMAQRQTRQLTRLVNDLLEVSRVSRGMIDLQCEPMMLAAAVYNAAESVSAAIGARGQTLRVAVPEEPVQIMADPVRVAQVLENLLTNASKYTPEGGSIRVEVDHAAGAVEVRVIDNGVGIEPEKIAHLFEFFSQLDVTIDRAQGGLGIGLALVKRLVELHGGSVTAASPGKGKGSTFTVRLPLGGPSQARLN